MRHPKEPLARPIMDLDRKQIELMFERIRNQVEPSDFEIISAMAESLIQVTALLRERGTTIVRLRRLFRLSKSEKSSSILPPKPSSEDLPIPDSSSDAASNPAPVLQPDGKEQQDKPKAKRKGGKKKGQGRRAASDYVQAEHIAVAHQTLRKGHRCPKCEQGNLFGLKDPAPIVRIFGNAPLVATCWDCERLRCNTCGHLFTAAPPKQAQGPKYEETAVSMMVLLRYNGMPFNRLERLQHNLQIPVPSSTQWDVINSAVEMVIPAFHELVRLAAQGQVLGNDDSYMRILEFMGKRRAALLARGELDDPERTGLFTSAIVAIVAPIGAIALFFTGRKHAGENLDQVLKQRAAGLPVPIQMSDALSRNVPKGHEVEQSNCLAHGRRQFVDEIENYPQECAFVIERLALVFKLDDDCRTKKLSDQERLVEHQRQSAPIMKELHDWMSAQLEEHRVEPNSGLGKAFNYLLTRWDKFTLFLRRPGAPLDNNIVERALKMTIKHRNASLFYRSQRGALVGDVFMTLIHTAELHHQNPFDYLTELQRNHKAVAQCPTDWMPWNYRDTLLRMREADPESQRAA
jgi:transposase